MKKLAALFLGLAMLSFSSGCYCGSGGCYMPNYLSPGYYGGGGYGGYGGGCPSGACGVGSTGGVPLGAVPTGMAPTYGQVQAGYPGTITAPVNSGAFIQPVGVPQMAVAPLEPLPTY